MIFDRRLSRPVLIGSPSGLLIWVVQEAVESVGHHLNWLLSKHKKGEIKREKKKQTRRGTQKVECKWKTRHHAISSRGVASQLPLKPRFFPVFFFWVPPIKEIIIFVFLILFSSHIELHLCYHAGILSVFLACVFHKLCCALTSGSSPFWYFLLLLDFFFYPLLVFCLSFSSFSAAVLIIEMTMLAPAPAPSCRLNGPGVDLFS